MASDPRRNQNSDRRPKIWAEGSQRPPFDIRALGRSSLFFARSGSATIFGGIARWGKQRAMNVRDGAGRIPESKLGRLAPYVPSHLRVAMWIKNWAAIAAHASATANPDVKCGNALVAEVETHLWPEASDAEAPKTPPPPGQAAGTAIQILGYLHGWAGAVLLLPYGLIRALVGFAMGQDLRKIGSEE